ncbi:MAG: leucine-rich repeat domain-containing protein [Selenomonadaceae bacterium]|nr:leucine-rich repeat domain-containing protein [Selenomonadaceae bacterium]
MPTYMDFEYERVNSEITIEKYHGSKASVNIPTKIKGLPVTEIGDFAFSDCSSLTNITIPDSVTSIGREAFLNCNSLKSIIIPDSVGDIGESAFLNCSSLESIIIPNSITSIGDSAFSGCRSLTNIIIPDSVTEIGNSAFYGCELLTNVIIANSVTFIGEQAFEDCSSLRSLIIPDSVKGIGNRAFGVCSSLESVIIPDSIKVIGKEAFISCSSLKNINIPDSVTDIGESSFSGCHSLTNITISDSVTYIGKQAFRDCKLLKSIVIPDSVTSIGEKIFEDFSSLKTIYFPKSLMNVSGVNNGIKKFTDEYGNKIYYYDLPVRFFKKISYLKNAPNVHEDILKLVRKIETTNSFYKFTDEMFTNADSILDDFIAVHKLQRRIATSYSINLIALINSVSQKKIINRLKYVQKFNDEIAKIETGTKEKLRALFATKPAVKKQSASVIGRPSNNQSKPTTNSITSQTRSMKKEMASEVSSNFKYSRIESAIQIDKYVGHDVSVTIPEHIEGLPVTTIGYKAFDNPDLRKVVIPASVNTIVYSGFVSKQSLHVLFNSKSIQLTTQSFIAPEVTFYFVNAIIYDSIYPIIKNNPKCIINYDAEDFIKI